MEPRLRGVGRLLSGYTQSQSVHTQLNRSGWSISTRVFFVHRPSAAATLSNADSADRAPGGSPPARVTATLPGMAVRGWGGPIATAVGGAAAAGAAQLGLGYGLGIIAWLPASNGASEAAWKASLAWATWIAASSTIAGALLADRAASTSTRVTTIGGGGANQVTLALWRVALALAAAVGALVTVALVAVPARAAVRADTFSPQTIAAGYAVLGVVVGLLVAIAALAARAIAANLIATGGWLWAVAILDVIDGVAGGRGLASAQLGVWHFTAGNGGYFRHIYLPGAALSLGAALVIGGLAALPAARRGDNRVGVAVSGAVGPLLVATAYFLAAPGLVGPVAEQLSAYLVAPYAVIAGLAGSVLASALPPITAPAGPRPPSVAGLAGPARTTPQPPGHAHPADADDADADAMSGDGGPTVGGWEDLPAPEPATARGSAAVPSTGSAQPSGAGAGRWGRLVRRMGGG
jgi:hypothetical protein